MPTKSKPNLSVIIPAYNEAGRLGPRLPEVLAFFLSRYPDHEIIIVDDGSTDRTRQVVAKQLARSRHAKLISYRPNRGKGYAIRQGVLNSRGRQVLFMDADLSTPLSEVPAILDRLKNADIVIGSRALPGKSRRSAPPFRRLASFIFDQIKFALVGLRQFRDTQCGFKAFRGDLARQLFAAGRIDRFMFDVEILYSAQKIGSRIREIPVSWADMPDSKVRFLPGLIQMFRDLWLIRRIHG